MKANECALVSRARRAPGACRRRAHSRRRLASDLTPASFFYDLTSSLPWKKTETPQAAVPGPFTRLRPKIAKKSSGLRLAFVRRSQQLLPLPTPSYLSRWCASCFTASSVPGKLIWLSRRPAVCRRSSRSASSRAFGRDVGHSEQSAELGFGDGQAEEPGRGEEGRRRQELAQEQRQVALDPLP